MNSSTAGTTCLVHSTLRGKACEPVLGLESKCICYNPTSQGGYNTQNNATEIERVLATEWYLLQQNRAPDVFNMKMVIVSAGR